MSKKTKYKRPTMRTHPHHMWRRLVRGWPVLAWLAIAGLAAVLYRGSADLGGMSGIVDTTAWPVAPSESAILSSLHVTVGQEVKEGDLLASMDTAVHDAAIAEIQAAMFDADLALANLERNMLDTVKTFDSAIREATLAIEDLKGRQGRDTARLAQMHAQLSKLESLYKKAVIPETDLAALRPDVVGLEHEVAAYPTLLRMEKERLANARDEQQRLASSLRLESGEEITDLRKTFQRRATAQRAVYESQIAAAELRKQRCELKASADGVISRIFYEPGLVVPAGAPVLRLVDSTPTQIIGFVPEVHRSRVRVGQKVTISRPGAGMQALSATVVMIAPEIDTIPSAATPIRGRMLRGRRALLRIDDPAPDLIAGETVRISLGRSGTESPLASRIRNLWRRHRSDGEQDV